MTPEQRAETVLREIVSAGELCREWHEAVAAIARAIREAVEAEQERTHDRSRQDYLN